MRFSFPIFSWLSNSGKPYGQSKKEWALLSICCVDNNTNIMGMIYAAVKRLRFYQIVPIAFRTDSNELYFIYKDIRCKSTAETAINQNIPFFINPYKFPLSHLEKTFRAEMPRSMNQNGGHSSTKNVMV